MSDPFEKFAPQEPDLTPEKRSSGILRTVLGVLAVLVVVTGFVLYYQATAPKADHAADTRPASTPVSRAPDPDEPAVGDCALLTGTALDVRYTRADCAAGTHNYVVGSQQRKGEDCGSATGTSKEQYARYRWTGALGLCLVPVFADGQCYRIQMFQAEMPVGECARPNLRVRVLAGTVDRTACEDEALKVLVYPEIRTTYCFEAP
ncbi:hypothetical protein AB0A74_01445 [Saccharothrix sp. NPDC042600]|uniref:LppU/SCO3897 family protein n=1 Tax=Saccharothrix TaxID=2071 RepID=UPI0034094C76|nr:hypothetical protein GCM10017745_50000 [Saccharothrix mutabilis subsp. capreolus]